MTNWEFFCFKQSIAIHNGMCQSQTGCGLHVFGMGGKSAGGWIRKGCMDGDRQREKEDGYGGLLVVLIWFLNTIPAPGMQAWGLRNPILLIRLCILVKASPAG